MVRLVFRAPVAQHKNSKMQPVFVLCHLGSGYVLKEVTEHEANFISSQRWSPSAMWCYVVRHL